eukprot:TRINITY_DN3731_c0_g1_i2.p1 TRINITY_DN3731_c0_g1~~TRINITY_DN3731_c0_g1_i2.p1  ORF type:complete len:170 (+),score=38.02 TRINITY_DN3731_c0_g1_i2:34-543(+)
MVAANVYASAQPPAGAGAEERVGVAGGEGLKSCNVQRELGISQEAGAEERVGVDGGEGLKSSNVQGELGISQKTGTFGEGGGGGNGEGGGPLGVVAAEELGAIGFIPKTDCADGGSPVVACVEAGGPCPSINTQPAAKYANKYTHSKINLNIFITQQINEIFRNDQEQC